MTEKEIVITGDLAQHARKVREAIIANDLIGIYERNKDVISSMSITDTKTNEIYTLTIDIGDKIVVDTKRKGVKHE